MFNFRPDQSKFNGVRSQHADLDQQHLFAASPLKTHTCRDATLESLTAELPTHA